MKIYSYLCLTSFEFWGGAKLNADQLTYDELEQVDFMLEDIYPEGCQETLINDLFWFEFETVCEWLGLELNEDGDVVRD